MHTSGAVLDDPPEMAPPARSIIEAIPAMVAIFDENLKYLYANRLYVEVVNSTEPTWQGLTVPQYLPQYLLDQLRERVQRVIQGESVSYYVDLVSTDGRPRTIHVNYAPFLEAERRVYVMTGQDVTELKLTQERLFAAQNLEILGRLAGGIAHDFNNHAGVIMGIFSLIKLRTADPTLHELCERGLEAAERNSRLTSQLLSFGGRQSIRPRPVAVARSIEKVLALVKVGIPKNVTVHYEDHTDGAAVVVDPGQFETAIINLLFNARDAIKDSGAIGVTSRFVHHNDTSVDGSHSGDNGGCGAVYQVQIEVADNGAGMSAEVAERAFDPFFTTKPPGEGAGMGLAMVNGFVRQAGGKIEVSTAPGRGTSVRVHFPHAERDEQADVVADEALSTSTTDRPASGVRLSVLVVEDDPQVAYVVRAILRSLGHITHGCSTGREALSILAGNGDVDVVLTDVVLSGPMSGLELRCRVAEHFPNIRVICTSGYQDPRSGATFELDREIEFLPKPITMEALADLLNRPNRSTDKVKGRDI